MTSTPSEQCALDSMTYDPKVSDMLLTLVKAVQGLQGELQQINKTLSTLSANQNKAMSAPKTSEAPRSSEFGSSRPAGGRFSRGPSNSFGRSASRGTGPRFSGHKEEESEGREFGGNNFPRKSSRPGGPRPGGKPKFSPKKGNGYPRVPKP